MRPVQVKQGKSKRGQFSQAQADYIARAVAEGCLVCRQMGHPGTPGNWHHAKQGFHGAGMRGPHEIGFCLCYEHHIGLRGVHTYRHRFMADAGMSETQLADLSQKLYGWTEA
jgi:hypothetical protein